MSQNTPLVQITGTWIESNNNSVQVVTGETDIQLWAGVWIDPSIASSGNRFDINWQIVEVATSHIQSNNWFSQILGGYPSILNQPGGGDLAWFIQNSVDNFGVHAGSGGWAEQQGSGMYILRVFIYIDTGEYEGNLYFPTGTSQWAISDDLVFWSE